MARRQVRRGEERRGDDGSEPYLIAQGGAVRCGAPSGLKVFVGTVNHTLGFGLWALGVVGYCMSSHE
jgi:hypothetical protein